MNGQAECLTPTDLPNYEGRSMSREETFGYALGLRASIWEMLEKYDSAISDYRVYYNVDSRAHCWRRSEYLIKTNKTLTFWL